VSAQPSIDGEAAIAGLMRVIETIGVEQLQTHAHSANVAAYAVELARGLGVPGERIDRVRRAAALHDIGKAAVPAAILGKPGPLTAAERMVVEEHPLVGEAMLVEAGLHDEARWVRSHHERFDGTGYPDGIAGHAIPLEARIIFVADSFETMTSDRPYRAGMAVEEAIAELRLCSGTQFDPAVVTAMIDLVLSGGLRVRALRAAML
jgi:putative nucleotidyltransferase with HDIG domain